MRKLRLETARISVQEHLVAMSKIKVWIYLFFLGTNDHLLSVTTFFRSVSPLVSGLLLEQIAVVYANLKFNYFSTSKIELQESVPCCLWRYILCLSSMCPVLVESCFFFLVYSAKKFIFHESISRKRITLFLLHNLHLLSVIYHARAHVFLLVEGQINL